MFHRFMLFVKPFHAVSLLTTRSVCIHILLYLAYLFAQYLSCYLLSLYDVFSSLTYLLTLLFISITFFALLPFHYSILQIFKLQMLMKSRSRRLSKHSLLMTDIFSLAILVVLRLRLSAVVVPVQCMPSLTVKLSVIYSGHCFTYTFFHFHFDKPITCP